MTEKIPTVLVTAIGSFSSSAVIPNLLKAGYRVVGCDIYPREWVVAGAEVDKFYQIPPVSECESYVKSVSKIVADEHADYIIPLTDFEVDVLSPVRESLGAHLLVSPKDAVVKCRDKIKAEAVIHSFLPELSIPTFTASEFLENEALCEGQWVCKPLDGRSSLGLYRAKSRLDALDHIKTHDLTKMIVQPQIDGRVVTVDVVREPLSGDVVSLPREELLRTANGAGTSVFVYRDSCLEQLCEAMACSLGVVGCVNFEFIKDAGGKYHFLECNPRFAGGVSFSCKYGYDFVINHMRCYMGEKIDRIEREDGQFIARRYVDYAI